ncbi:hypothetical protein K8Q94_02105 [Candidatus Nomurabacteria bacterium]|nr:hypothetical protein [Candidatus Nomurabacteria bacterium]
MNYINKTIFKSAFVILAIAFSVQALAVWQNPTGTPPNANVSAPLNVSTSTQYKPGSVLVNGFRSFGPSIFDQGITSSGTVTSDNLSLGSFMLNKSDSSPNAGYLRFGDKTGWKFHIGRLKETVNGAFNTGTTGSIMTFQDNGSVGIGTTSPTSRLDVRGDVQISDGLTVAGPTFLQSANIVLGGLRSMTSAIFDAGLTSDGLITATGLKINGNADVSGTVKIGNTNAPCTTALAGTQRYNNLLMPMKMQFCNGTAWTDIGSASTASSYWSAGTGIGSTNDIFYTAGKVGIGTNTPTNTLSVNGDLGVANTLNSNGGFYLNGTAGGAGTASQGIFFGGSGVAHGNISWYPNEKTFILGTGNTPTATGNVYGPANFKIPGQLTVAGGSPGAGKVLTSDANGLASWQTPATGGGTVTSPWASATDPETGNTSIYNTNNKYVGIGTSTPATNLDVNGKIKISGGSPGAGKVLTSDANGLASWQTLPSPSWTVSGNDITYGSGNVAIGTTPVSGHALTVNGKSYLTGGIDSFGVLTNSGNVVIAGSTSTIRGATYGFGGSYIVGFDNSTCLKSNTFTAGCSCPTGFTVQDLGVGVATMGLTTGSSGTSYNITSAGPMKMCVK